MLEIDLLPDAPGHVGGSESRGEGERRHVLQMRRQLREQRRRLVVRKKADAPRRLFQEPNGGRPIQPLPVASALAQD